MFTNYTDIVEINIRLGLNGKIIRLSYLSYMKKVMSHLSEHV